MEISLDLPSERRNQGGKEVISLRHCGEILTTEATQSSLKLPATGNYEIIVGGTRGNATYKLNVKIQ